MILFWLITDFWPNILLSSDYSAIKSVLITDFDAKILLITGFGPEILLTTDFWGTPLRRLAKQPTPTSPRQMSHDITKSTK